EGKPDRKTYSITENGRLELALGLSQPPSKDKFKSEFLLVAMNASLAGPAAIKRAIAQRIEWLEAEVEMLSGVVTECDNPATRWVANYGVAVMGNDLNYLKENQDELVSLASGPVQVEAAE
ncbi:MAG: PadR family transcriptional regulator, partial [Pseudomonadota bacterium]